MELAEPNDKVPVPVKVKVEAVLLLLLINAPPLLMPVPLMVRLPLLENV